MGTRRSIRLVVLASIGGAALLLTLYLISPHSVSVGGEYTVPDGWPLAVCETRELAADLGTTAHQFLYLREYRLERLGRIVLVSPGVKVRILDRCTHLGIPLAEVKSLDGADVGVRGWVVQEALSPKPETAKPER